MKLSKKLFATIVTIALCACMAVMFAVSADARSTGGNCGSNAKWSLNYDTGMLSITGSGAIRDCSSPDFAPWYKEAAKVKSISVGNGITALGNWAFDSCIYAESVSLPSSLKSIGIGAFCNCVSLKSINLPSGVTSIGAYAFYGCASIKEIRIPGSVTSIKHSTFNYCNALATVYLPAGLRSLDTSAFDLCPAITSYSIPESNALYSTMNGLLYNKDKTILFRYPVGSVRTVFTVPSGVSTIADKAFLAASKLNQVVFPTSLEVIGRSAFQNCNGLQRVILPSSVSVICSDAFYAEGILEINVTNRNCEIYGDKKGTTLCAATIYGPASSTTKAFVDKLYEEDDLDYNFAVLGSDLTVMNFKASYTSSTITFSWNKIDSATHYALYHYENGSYKKIKTVKTPSVTLSGLEPLSSGYYRVMASKVSGDTVISGKYSSTLTATTGLEKTVGISSLSNVTPTSFTVSWKAVDKAQGYIIYRVDGSTLKKLAATSDTKATVSGLVSGSTSSYCIRAFININGSTVLGDASGKFVACLPLAPVSGLSLSTSSSTSVTLKWNAVSGAAGYSVYQYKDGSWIKLLSTTLTTRRIGNLSPNSAYSFKVRAYKTYNSKFYLSPISDSFLVYTGPTATSGLYSSYQTASSTYLKWDSVPGASGYQVYMIKDGSWVNAATCKSCFANMSGLKSGTAYTYRVRAYRIRNDVTYYGDYSQNYTVRTK